MTTTILKLIAAGTRRFVHVHKRVARDDERGAALAEYGLLLALVLLAAVSALALFGGELLELWTQAEDDFNTLPDPPAAD